MLSLKNVCKKVLELGAVCFAAVAIGSCGDNVGLGASVDTEAPTIFITYPPVSASIRGTFVFAGTCADDKGVTSIKATITNTTTKQTYPANDVILGENNTWSVLVNDYNSEKSDFYNGWQLPDGTYEIGVVAYDAAGHTSGSATTRTFDIDNTAPVVVLKSPSSIKSETAYGATFKVEGDIAEAHTISSLSVTIYDAEGNPKGNTDIEPYTETRVATADASVTLLRFSASASRTVAAQRYADIYGDEIPDNDFEKTKKYTCTITVTDSTKLYGEEQYAKYLESSEIEDTGGNATTTFYLNGDVYETLISKDSYGLERSDLLAISNKTYIASDAVDAARAAASDIVIGELTSEQLAVVENLLAEKKVNTANEDSRLKFSLNPAVNPSYIINGFALSEDTEPPLGLKSQTVNFNVSSGLDGTQFRPQTVKVYMLNGGKYDKEKGFVFEEAFLADPEAYFIEHPDTVELLHDYSEDFDETQTRSTLTRNFKLPEIISGNYYVFGIAGYDLDKHEFVPDDTYAFIGTTSSNPPRITITDYPEFAANSADVVITGKADSTDAAIDYLDFEVTFDDSDNTNSWKGTLPIEATDASVPWEIKLENADGYKAQESGKNINYTFEITAYDTNGSKSESKTATVLVDTASPKVTYNEALLGSDVTITNTNTYYSKDADGNFVYRLSGAWSDENGSGTNILYYSIDGGKNWAQATDFASATTERSWNVDLVVGQTQSGKISFYAKDKAGNESNHVDLTGITFDYENPTFANVVAPATSVRVGDTITAKGTVSDTLALPTESPYGITVTATKDGEPYTIKADELTFTRGEDGKTADYALAIPSAGNDGAWEITVSAKDAAGLSAATQTYTVTVDAEKPTIAIGDTATKYSRSSVPLTFEGTMNDNVAVTSVYYYVSEKADDTIDPSSENWKAAAIEKDATQGEAGEWSANINFKSFDKTKTYYVYFAAKDAVGNSTVAEGSVPVVLDDTAPTTTLTATNVFDTTGAAVVQLDGKTKATYLAKDSFVLGGTITETNLGSATDATATGISISVNDGEAQPITPNADGTWTYEPTVTEDGSYTYVISLEDKAENTETYTVTVQRDTLGPVVTVTSPTEGEQIADATWTVRGTTNDEYAGAKALFYTTADSPADDDWKKIDLTGSNWAEDLSFESEGTVTLKVRATDALGNEGAVKTCTFYYDKEAPQLEETSISGNGLTTNAEIAIGGTASDTNALRNDGKDTVEVLEGTTELGRFSVDDEGAWAGTLAVGGTNGLSDGMHTLTVRAYDAANRVTTLQRIVTVDTTAPTLSDPQIASETVYLDESSYNALSVAASDGGTGLSGVYYQVVSATAEAPTVSTSTELTGADVWTPLVRGSDSWTANIDFKGKDEAAYTVYLAATDQAGNVSDVLPLGKAITLDKTKPVIASITNGSTVIGTSDTAQNADISYAVKITDTNPASASVTITKPDGTTAETPISSADLTGGTATITVPFATTYADDGVYTLAFTATDANGRVSDEKRFTVLKDSTPPQVSITTPNADGFHNANSFTFAGTASDENLSTVTAALFRAGVDGAVQSATLNPDKDGNWTWKVYDLADADYTVTVTAKDAVNNETPATSQKITVDTVAPTTTLSGTGLFTSAGAAVSGALSAGSTYFAKDTFSLQGAITEANLQTATVNDSDISTEAPSWTYSPTVTADGSTTYVIALEDKAKNKSEYRIIVTRDSTPPELTVSGLAKNAVYTEANVTALDATARTATYTVTGTWKDQFAGTSTLQYTTASDVTNLSEGDDAATAWKTIENATTATGVSTSWTLALPVSESLANSISFRAKDAIGNVSEPTSFSGITFDFGAPTITLAAAPNARITNTKDGVTFTGTISDALGVNKSDITITATKNSTAQTSVSPTWSTDTDTARTFTITLPTNTAGNDGDWTISVAAKDKANRDAVSQSVATRIDTTLPTISSSAIDGIAEAQKETTGDETIVYFNSKNLFNMTVAAADDGSGLASVEYAIASGHEAYNEEAEKIVAWTKTTEVGTGWEATVKGLIGKTDGAYTIFTRATDAAGNQSAISSIKVITDTQDPELKETDGIGAYIATNETDNTFKLKGTVDDTHFASITVAAEATNTKDTAATTISKETTTTDDKTQTTWSVTQAVNSDDESHGFTYTITATDKAGNTSVITKRVAIDRTAPTITISTLNTKEIDDNLQINTASGQFKGTVTDELSGISLMKGYLFTADDFTDTETILAAVEQSLRVDARLTEATVSDDQKTLIAKAKVNNSIAFNTGNNSWDTTFVAPDEGWYVPVFVAADSAGNITAQAGKSFGTDFQAPKSTLSVSAGDVYEIVTQSGSKTSETLNSTTNYGDGGNNNRWSNGVTYYAKAGFTLSGTITDTFNFTTSGVALTVNNKAATLNFEGNGTTDGDLSTLKWSYQHTDTQETTYTYRLTLTDKSGNSVTKQFVVQMDTTQPAVQITAPASNAIVTQDSVAIEGTVVDAGSGVKEVTYTIKTDENDANPKTGTAKVEGGKWSANVTGLPQGTLTLSVTTKDYLDNEETSGAQTFFYDKTAPVFATEEATKPRITTTLAKTAGTDNVLWFNTSTLALAATASDVHSGVASITYQVDNGSEIALTPADGSTGNPNAAYSATANSVVVQDGEHTITIKAMDKVGLSTTQTFTVHVDNVAPAFGETVSVRKGDTDVTASNENVTISGTVTEAQGLDLSKFTVTATKDGAAVADLTNVITLTTPTTATGENLAWSFVVKKGENNANDGLWVFTVTATDQVGLTATKTAQVRIDTTPPTFVNAGTAAVNPSLFTIGTADYTIGEGADSETKFFKDTTLKIGTKLNETGSGLSDVFYYVQKPDETFTHGNDLTLPEKHSGSTSSTLTGAAIAITLTPDTFAENDSSKTPPYNVIYIQAVDNVGNKSKVQEFRVNVDQTAPEFATNFYTSSSASATPNKLSATVLTNKANDLTLYGTLSDKSSGAQELDFSTVTGTNAVTVTYTDASETLLTEASTVSGTSVTYKPYSEFTDKSLITGWKAVISAKTGLDVNAGTGFYIVPKDKAGNGVSQRVFTLNIDTEAPEITFTAGQSQKVYTYNNAGGTVTENKDADSASVAVINGDISVTGKASDSNEVTSVSVYYTTNASDLKTLVQAQKLQEFTGADVYSWSLSTAVSQGIAMLGTPNGNEKLTNTYTGTAEDIYLQFVVEDSAGNNGIHVFKYQIDPDKDRPVFNITSVSGAGGTLTNDTVLQGRVSDDDGITGDCVFKVSERPVTTATAWESVTTASNTTGALNKGQASFDTATGDFRYRPLSDDDNEKTLYFYFKDAAGAEFWTAYNASTETGTAKTTENTHFTPKLQFKGDSNTQIASTTAFTYKTDGNAPGFTRAVAATSKDATDNTEDSTKSDFKAVSTSLVLGGASPKAVFKFEASDSLNGVAGMSLTLKSSAGTDLGTTYGTAATITTDTTSITALTKSGTFTPTEGNATAIWTTDEIDLAKFDTGSVTATVNVWDKSGLKGNNSYTFMLDKTGPNITVTSPSQTEELNGVISLTGTAVDTGGGTTSEIQWLIPTAEQRSMDAAALNALTWNGTNSGSSATAWQFDFNTTAISNQTLNDYTNDTYYTSVTDGVYTLPIYLRAVDDLGNYTISKNFSLRYNPDGDRPKTAITYPTESDYDTITSADGTKTKANYISLGGPIRVTGTAEVPSAKATIAKVYFQFVEEIAANFSSSSFASGKGYTIATAPSVTGITTYDWGSISSAGWWGIDATGLSSWTQILNAGGNLNPAAGETTDIKIRACAVNSNGKVGAWTEPVVIHVDNTAPVASASLFQISKDNPTNTELYNALTKGTSRTASRSYEADMYLRGQWYLAVKIDDETGVKIDGVTRDLSEADYTLYPDSSIEKGNELTGSNRWERYVFIKLGTSGSSDYVITASDMDTNAHTISPTYSINIDNTAPQLTSLTGSGDALISAETGFVAPNIVEKNSVYTLGGTVSEEGSGFAFSAFYFMRGSKVGSFDIENQVLIDPIYYDATDATNTIYKRTGRKASIGTDITAAPAYTQGVGNSETINNLFYGKTIAGKEKGTTFTPTTPTDITDNKFIRKNGLILVGGAYRIITDINASTGVVTFDTDTGIQSDVSADAFFPYALVVDNTSTEKTGSSPSTYPIGNNIEANDDGDGMPESVVKSGTTWSWDGTIHSLSLPDGPITLVVVTFDKAGNVVRHTVDTQVTNNAPRLAKLYLGTDLNGDEKFGEGEFVPYDMYTKEGAYQSSIVLQTAGYDTGYEAFRVTDKLAVVPEIVGGNGDISLVFNKAASGNIADGKISKVDTSESPLAAATKHAADDATSVQMASTATYTANFTKQAGNALWAYTLENDALPSTDGTSTMQFTFYDATEETKPGVTSQYATVAITDFTIDLEDEVAPEATITPFYWKSETENSLYYNGNARYGHIDLGEYRNGVPAVSGIIKIEGTAHDDQRLGSLTLSAGDTKIDSITYTPTANTWSTAGNKDLKTKYYYLEVTKSEFSQSGHDITWQLTIDTANAIGNAESKTITVVATQAKGKETKLTSTPGTTQTGWKNNAFDSNATTGYYNVSVVPYIAAIDRSNSTAISGGNMNRSKQGHYPVSEGETITVYGYNFGASDAKNNTTTAPTVTVGSTAIVRGASTQSGMAAAATNANGWGSFTMTVPSVSGYLKVTNVTSSLNNDNQDPTISANASTTPALNYNLESYQMRGNSTWYYADDDRYLAVWSLGNYFKNTDNGAELQQPVMAADRNGNLYASWAAQSNSNIMFSYGVKENTTAIYRNYDQPSTMTGIGFDTKSSNDKNQYGASVAFIPEHQGYGGTFSQTGLSSSQIVGGMGAIKIPYSLIQNKKVMTGTQVSVAENPNYKMDGENYTAYFNIANYDMNRRLGSYENPKSARYEKYVHTIWYDNVTESLRYAVINTEASQYGVMKMTDNSTTTNGVAGGVVGWVVLDGGYTGQDRQHVWKNGAGQTNNTLSAGQQNATWVGTGKDTDGKNSATASYQANYTTDTFLASAAQRLADMGTQGNKFIDEFGQTNLTSLTLKNVQTVIEPKIGDSIGLYQGTSGDYKVTIKTITNITDNTYENNTFSGKIHWDGAVTHQVHHATIYSGTMQVVSDANTKSVREFTTFTDVSTSSGSSAAIDVTSTGFPVVAYFDDASSRLRIAMSRSKNSWEAKSWKRVTTTYDCSGYVSMRLDAKDNIHIMYKNGDGQLCYLFGEPTGVNNNWTAGQSYKFNDPEVIDETGSLDYGSLSIIEKTVDGATVYIPCVTYLNSAGTAQGVKYAYRTSAPVSGEKSSADNWDYMILPSLGSGHYAVAANQVSIEAHKSGWDNTETDTLRNGGAQATVTPKTVQAAVAFKSKQFETAYLRTE